MNFIAKKPISDSAEDQISEILRMARQLIRSADSKENGTKTDGITPAMHRLMSLLKQSGPQTVPALARSLNTGRQHIQRLVNSLAEQGLVQREANPAHRRSWLISLSEAGTTRARRAVNQEKGAVAELADGLSVEDLQACQDVMHHLLGKLDQAPSPEPARPIQKRRTKRVVAEKKILDDQKSDEPIRETATETVPPETGTIEPMPEPSAMTPAGGLNWNGGGGLQIG